jgi:DNA-binding GntR family transcriptional regulator
MRRTWPVPLFVLPLLLYSSIADYTSVQKKFDLIEHDRLRPGSRVTLSQRELNAYVEQQVPQVAPQGVRDPRIELGAGMATGSAVIDFVRLRSAQGKPEYLIQNYLLPYYPEAKVGEPFALSHHIDRIDLQPARVDVILKK